jgi:predicted Zn-dependent protease
LETDAGNLMLKKLLLILLLTTSCSNFQAKVTSITLDENSLWLEDSLIQSLNFWATKDILYTHKIERVTSRDREIGAEDSIITGDLGNKIDLGGSAIGHCYCFAGDLVSEIVVEKSLFDNPTKYTSCLLTHELGHYIGMEHVEEGNSIMSPAIKVDCDWSRLDQEEFWRVSE